MNALAAQSEITLDELIDRIAERVIEKMPAAQPQTQLTMYDQAKVTELTSYSAAQISRMIEKGVFPEQARGGGSGSKKLWRSTDVDLWLKGKKLA
ncbi:hypothetical protein [Pyramidobacter piscolens]|uniref:hypothetical protein n=1 Tax=Pyramidobacter piscolens TaxID=638849 RepID=UPI001FCBF8A9|nr:hypothetical protein [Pyramidobacter piscolens]BDF78357.1 hypothetical protein CE91St28_11510 [Pyramidobacter piscolens]